MQGFIAVAIMAWTCILSCTDCAGVEANQEHIDATFPELLVDAVSPNLVHRGAGENNPSISDGELIAVRLEAIGVYDTIGMGAALKGPGLWTPPDLELLDD
jgi:hypothetical protein